MDSLRHPQGRATQQANLASPPYLVIHGSLAWWIEERPVMEWTATLSAMRDGCFRKAWVYDLRGGVWPITGAAFRCEPTLAQRLLPWRRAPVAIGLGAKVDVAVETVRDRLEPLLFSFAEEYLKACAAEKALQRLRCAATAAEVFQAFQYAEHQKC